MSTGESLGSLDQSAGEKLRQKDTLLGLVEATNPVHSHWLTTPSDALIFLKATPSKGDIPLIDLT
jgi:hypothetical protein